MKKISILVTALLLGACNSPRVYQHFSSAYWTPDNQLKIQFSHAGQNQYYQVKRDGSDVKTIAETDYWGFTRPQNRDQGSQPQPPECVAQVCDGGD